MLTDRQIQNNILYVIAYVHAYMRITHLNTTDYVFDVRMCIRAHACEELHIPSQYMCMHD